MWTDYKVGEKIVPRIKCSTVECKYNSPTCYCTYKGTLLMGDSFIMTKHEGRQHFHRCKMFEVDESIEQMQKEIIDFFKEKMK